MNDVNTVIWDPIHYRTYTGQWTGKGKRCKCEACKAIPLKIRNAYKHKNVKPPKI